MGGSTLAILGYAAAVLVFSCAERSAPVAAPVTAVSVAPTSPSPHPHRDVVPASSTNPREEVRAEIRRREDADIELGARGHGERHPERLVVRAELESLRASDKAWTPNGGPREVRLALLRASEAGLLVGRGENHPDVLAVRAKIRAAEGSP
jgi:hypothetical protein